MELDSTNSSEVGFSFRQFPILANPLNHVAQISKPVLVLNGRYDYLRPVDERQILVFNLPGTAAENNRHVLYKAGQSPAYE